MCNGFKCNFRTARHPPEADSQFHGDIEDLPEKEKMLIDDGYEIASYNVMPFGYKHFFYKLEMRAFISETTFGKCTMSSTFIPENIPTDSPEISK